MPTEHSNSLDASPVIEFSGQAHGFTGYAFGLQQPALMFSVRVKLPDMNLLMVADKTCSSLFNAPVETWTGELDSPALERLIYWTRTLLESKGHPVFVAPRIVVESNVSPDLRKVIFPCLQPKAALGAVRFVISTLNRLLIEPASNEKTAAQNLAEEVERIGQWLSRSGVQGFNTVHFLQAANELGIPWQSLVGNIMQFGQGARARWLDSSLTDLTPSIAAQLARNKKGAATMLRLAGVPVPAHFLAGTEDAAVRYAEELGYPVVVKPADLDGGVGVAAHLTTPASVRKAFSAAKAVSPHVLVEKHVPGRDYRLQVVRGEVQGVLERVPGGVTGNGQDTVRALVERQNNERRTATDDRRYLHAITLDDEAEALLSVQETTWDTVPVAGRVIRLRGAANVTNGGVPVPVSLENVHRDNLTLARRAAQALRLDVAGIDLLIPDIATSWHQSGAYVCEVNAQPQMFTTMHRPMLQTLVRGNGRIPVIVFLDGVTRPAAVTKVQRGLIAAGLRTGFANVHGVWISDEVVAKPGIDACAGGKLLLQDPTVDAVVLHVADQTVLRHGWPFDRCTVLVLGHEPIDPSAEAAITFTKIAGFARGLAPRHIFVDGRAGASAALAKAYFGQHPNVKIISAEGASDLTHDNLLAEAVLSVLIHATQPQGQSGIRE